ncbi:MAG TPA: phosphoribosylformylglycinamidine synthase subunit PurL [Polyangiaceae bacterium LLY-WYZ-15_(1-7)]|nr:phosphoribosylformylglycinamidine synthase subunit PurL [Polyangiaceae bacterium LLY-WYZ-15_(1-7)]
MSASPVALPGEPAATEALAKEFGLSADEYAHALEVLGRTPTYAELGVISVMWSEHCSYKSSRVHLARLPTEGPKVVQGPGENAGAVDIGDGFCAVFKMESHNHPSYIEPYQGAATGVGGILRDVFTMGARPIASLNSLRFGRPDHPKTPHLLKGVVAGIGGYGNCIGVPTVGGEVQFDPSYDGNILVNAFTVGIAKSEELFFGTASGVGNPVIYVGARTGRDGIHGATMASAEFGEETESKLPTVQVGAPFMEKLLLEACLEIFASDCLEGVQDMGAAGLTSSSVEMASRAGTGLELDLDAIPRRTKALSPYEMLLSESQERMLMVAKAGREQEVFDACAKWDLEAAVVGHVTDTGRFVCKATPGYDPMVDPPEKAAPEVVVDLPIGLLADDAPKYDRPQKAPGVRTMTTQEMTSVSVGGASSQVDVGAELRALIGAPNVGSKRWIWRQYDHVVRDGTVVGPGEGDAAVVRAFCEEADGSILEKFLAVSVDCNGRHVFLDPLQGGAMAVAECARNIVCVGGEPLGLTDCLNFGNPEVPETMWAFAQAIDGLASACRALGVPVVSGNVSLYNETDGKPILPTPTVAIVGQLRSAEDRLGLAFDPAGAEAGHVIAHLGVPSRGALGGSEWLFAKQGRVSGEPVGIDLDAEVALQKAVLTLARGHLLASAHDVSEGGLAVCLAESCLTKGVGAQVRMPQTGGELPPEAYLFAEEPSRIVVSFAPAHKDAVRKVCEEHGVPFEVLGVVGGDALDIDGVCSVPVAELEAAHRTALDAIVGDDA